MDKKVLRERARRKKRQMMIRRYTRMAVYAVGVILLAVFVIRGIILPIAGRKGSGGEQAQPVQAQEVVEVDPNEAVRQPLKGKSDVVKVTAHTPGWHDSEDGRWYQNADGTYYADGFRQIDGSTYCFDNNGYIQTGWVTKGAAEYYFNDDGTYNPEKRRPMLALTYDDGPGQYTDRLLDCLEENGAHATFFMLGQNVEAFPEIPSRMLEIGCEVGSHSWDHLQLTTLSLEEAVAEYTKTDDKLLEVCGQAATVARAPYGSYNDEIIQSVGKPFFMWSLDSLDWSYKDVTLDYNEIMNGDLTDGSIILMHDIHEASVETSLKIIPELIEKGYRLVTVSELAQAKGVQLQSASYSDFWDSSLAAGLVAGYTGQSGSPLGIPDSTGSDDSSSEDGSLDDGGNSDGSDDETVSDGSDSYDDGSDEYYE